MKRISILSIILVCVAIFGGFYFVQQHYPSKTKFTLIFDPNLTSDGDIQLNRDLIDGQQDIGNSYDVKLTNRDGKVYVYDHEVVGADPITIKPISKNFLTDKDSVYIIRHLKVEKIEGLSPHNLRFAHLEHPSVLVNDTQVYFVGDGNIGQFVSIVSEPKELHTVYIEDKTHILLTDAQNLYLATNHHFFAFPTASPDFLDMSFYIMGEDEVFYEAQRIPAADISTFELIKHAGANKQTKGSYARIFYAKDKNNVYFKGNIVAGADPKSFMVYDVPFYQEYARDNQHVYIDGQVIPGADPLTFTVLKKQVYEGCGYGQYGRDAHAVYHSTNIVRHADPVTFEILYNHYGKDAQRTFWRDRELPFLPKDFYVSCPYG